jgi:hypothetical protein
MVNSRRKRQGAAPIALALVALLLAACGPTPSHPGTTSTSILPSVPTTGMSSTTLFDDGFPFTTSSQPPSDLALFWRELDGDGYTGYKFDTAQEGETQVKIIWVSVDADKESQATYEAICDHVISLAKQYGLWTSSDWRVRVVLVEATDEQKVLEQRDFNLSGSAERE